LKFGYQKILDDLRGTKVQFSANLVQAKLSVTDTLALSVDTLEGWGVKCGVLQLISTFQKLRLLSKMFCGKLSDHALCDGQKLSNYTTQECWPQPLYVPHQHLTIFPAHLYCASALLWSKEDSSFDILYVVA